MSTVTDPMPASAPPTPAALLPTAALVAAPRVVVNGEVHIPAGIVDLESFRRWTHTDDFPTRGRIDYIDGVLWVDVTMEQIYTHVRIKGEFGVVVGGLVRSADMGLFLPDGARLVIPAVGLSTEPDASFVSYGRLDSGQVREVPGRQHGVVELEGTPDMVLEIVSDSSVEKDTQRLPEQYRQAGLPEFWRVDVRGEVVRFEILHLIEGVHQLMAEADGWWRSAVFARSFRLTQQADRRGQPRFVLDVRE
jgi:Uma2 family endonuclease